MTIETLKSPNARNRNSISVIKSKFLSVSSMNTLLATVLKVTDARRDVILSGGLYHRFPWRHLPPWFQPKIYATNTARCPVSFYKNFRSHRPTEMNAPESPFYLAVGHNRRSNEEVWYMNATLGKNEIGRFLSTAAKNAGLHREGQKVTNHSVRKTCISRSLDTHVPENFVAQLSGHKSRESLQSYKSASAKHQKRISLTLSRADLSGTRNEALSSVHNQGFEVVTRSTTDIAASSTTNTLIDPSSDPFNSVFQRSSFYRCKRRIHQRVHIPNISW